MEIKFGRFGRNDNVILSIEETEFRLILYYIKTDEGFKVLTKKPEEGDYGEFYVVFELEGMMGGPAVWFREVNSPLCGELLDLPRGASPVSMDIQLPEGTVIARDGIGDWSRIINLSKRQSIYVSNKAV